MRTDTTYPLIIQFFVISMPVYISSLNSGSNGNCYYVGNSNGAVLIDAGLSCREIEKRMSRSGLKIQHVKAIFISHEHGDHIHGVEVLSRKHNLPVYITEETRISGRVNIDRTLLRSFNAYEKISIEDILITAFPKLHDAVDPHSFIVETEEVKVGVLTDIGAACEHVIKNFSQCNVAFLEANYDEEMLNKGRYPYHLKKRISGDKGHLSNTQALQLFKSFRSEALSHLILSHLSRDNNSPELVQQLFDQYAGDTRITVASRYKESEVFEVGKIFDKNKPAAKFSSQLSLFPPTESGNLSH